MKRKNKLNIKVNEISEDTKASLKKRVIIGILMAIVVVPCVFIGTWAYLALVVLAVGAATYEIARVPSKKLYWLVWAVTFITMYSLIFWVAVKEAFSEYDEWVSWDSFCRLFNEVWLSPIAIAVMIGMFFIVIIFTKEFDVSDACYLIAMTLLISFGFQSLLYIRYIPFTQFNKPGSVLIESSSFRYFQSALLLVYLLIATCFNDMGAYFVGILFGKHKMNPRISPKKTWEGFAGGIVFSCVFSMIFALLCAHYNKALLPIFTIDKWYWILLCSIVLPLFGDLGDFAFSAIKRHFGVKDYSHVLGPHGGILDRIDSVLFSGAALAILVTMISNNWSFLTQN